METGSGRVAAGTVVSATAGWSSTIAAMAGLRLPIVTHPLQAFVTEPLKPLIDTTISSANLHVYAYQTERGEVVIGGAVDSYPTYSHRSTLHMLETARRTRARTAAFPARRRRSCGSGPAYAT